MVPHANQPPSTVDIALTHALDARPRALDDALARERPAGMNSSLKVCTWNAQMLPGVFAGQGGTKTDIAKRAHAMANNILCCSRADAIDVVCLQEMWEVEAAKALKVALREEFPFVYAPSARCGLMVASKFSMVCNHFTALPAKGIERLAFTKGVSTSFLRLTSAEDATTRVAIVLNTHLQSDYWSSGRDTRAKQISCIKDAVHRAEMECAGNGYEVDRIMLVGDLNIVAGSGEYEDLMNKFSGAVDLMAPLTDIDGSVRRGVAGREGSTRGVDRSFRLTFPVARWRHVVLPCLRGQSRYIDLEPKVVIDYVIDLTSMVTRGVPLHHRHADSGYVHHAMCRDSQGRALSDHYPVVAVSRKFPDYKATRQSQGSTTLAA